LKQLFVGLVGIAACLCVVRIGYRRIAPWAYVLFGLSTLLLLPMVISKYTHFNFGGLVPESRGAHRWIQVPGVQLQPSELMKIGYILGLAWYLRYRRNYRTFWGLFAPFMMSFVPMALILLEPDLGTVLLFLPVLFGMLFVAGARLRHLAIIACLGVAAVPVLWSKMEAYQRSRVVAAALQSTTLRERMVANPEKWSFTGFTKRDVLEWEASSGMQLVRSKAALGSGGFFGKGWGRGTYVEQNFLPDRHNDFIFAIVGHQWGLLGCLVVLGCYALVAVCGAEIALSTPEPFGRLLAMGVVCLMAAQTIINIGMTIGLMPVTGMTLPFVSYGGSSLVTNFIAIGLLISVAQNRPFMLERRPFEWNERGVDPLAGMRPPRASTVGR
jgi:cell division protein FtsW (lipid II flippase)